MDIELSVYNKYEVRKNLRLINVHKGMETLGVVMAPDRNSSDCFISLGKKVLK